MDWHQEDLTYMLVPMEFSAWTQLLRIKQEQMITLGMMALQVGLGMMKNVHTVLNTLLQIHQILCVNVVFHRLAITSRFCPPHIILKNVLITHTNQIMAQHLVFNVALERNITKPNIRPNTTVMNMRTIMETQSF
tara:strand:- start:596 stop:1000 length:405 start_codon:yes stop_codon:yes gene_type:complete